MLTMLVETSKKNGAQHKREPLTVRFTRVIRSAIMNGEFALGERLVEMTLAERYNVSRQVVRVALQALEGEGLVVSDAFCGRSVIDLDSKEFEALFLIRISLESTAAALAAYKITQEQGRQLMENARLLREEPRDFSQLVEWDAAIHRAIWQIADEPLLTTYLEKLIWPFIVSGSRVEIAHSDQQSLLRSQIEREQSNHAGGHRPLLQAICRQDPTAAREAVIRHMLSTGTLDYSREAANAFAATFSVPNLQSA
jgi:DNA-binding GntR family transcriptional regulator